MKILIYGSDVTSINDAQYLVRKSNFPVVRLPAKKILILSYREFKMQKFQFKLKYFESQYLCKCIFY